jgi:hypothetical protein
MPKRSYDQYCPLACALDLIGERWTLLIVRDLLAGPKRYTDLHQGLPGFGFSLLGEPPTAEDPPTPDRFGLLLRMLFNPDAAPREPETWVFGGGDAPIAVTVSRAGVELHTDPEQMPRPPSARFIGDVPTIYDLVVGRLDTPAALADGRLRIEGDAGALDRMRAALPIPGQREAVAA